MPSYVYYGVKGQLNTSSFAQVQWLTAAQACNLLLTDDTKAYLHDNFIQPNELIINSSGHIVDVLLLAKYRTKHGTIKLRNVSIHELKQQSTLSPSLFVLHLPKDSYFWCKVNNNNIPMHALRAGYDANTRQFCFIGRVKCNQDHQVGTLAQLYEYIPTVVLQLHSNEFLSCNNYEVLCLRTIPATLQQLCINSLLSSAQNNEDNSCVRNLLWPACLTTGQCIAKGGKMRSNNGQYELGITRSGVLKFTRYHQTKKCITTYEKNVESLVVINSGVFVIFDEHQAQRRPIVLYENKQQKQENGYYDDTKTFDSLFSCSLRHKNFVLELCDNGQLRVIVLYNSRHLVANLIDLNEFFIKPVAFVEQKQQVVQVSKNKNVVSFRFELKHAISMFMNFFKRLFRRFV